MDKFYTFVAPYYYNRLNIIITTDSVDIFAVIL